MPAKQIRFRSDARERVFRGATALADVIRVTLGPKSRCVLLERKWGRPIVCDDGVTIAKETELADPEENLGAQMLRQAAEQTGDRVGDGTTTSTILAYEMYAEGLKNVAAGAAAVEMRRGLEAALTVDYDRMPGVITELGLSRFANTNYPDVAARIAGIRRSA